ncbi:hypothetical protein EV126DRAFT_423823 [Verticillium dahliae]|nr:hypothetical protein EV126DRAFT_423823 [Verticillium dahliae]
MALSQGAFSSSDSSERSRGRRSYFRRQALRQAMDNEQEQKRAEAERLEWGRQREEALRREPFRCDGRCGLICEDCVSTSMEVVIPGSVVIDKVEKSSVVCRPTLRRESYFHEKDGDCGYCGSDSVVCSCHDGEGTFLSYVSKDHSEVKCKKVEINSRSKMRWRILCGSTACERCALKRKLNEKDERGEGVIDVDEVLFVEQGEGESF